MNTQGIKQFGISLAIVLSLFASSVSTCLCSHHQEKVKSSGISCHQQMMMDMEDHSDKPESAASLIKVDAGENCNCIQPASHAFAKSKIIKIEKYPAALAQNQAISFELSAPPVKAETTIYVKPLYLSDSFYNLKPPRGPPVL